ncbi:hypothetical protein TTHERM_00415630 (macronuclear) [Tetrahymena thermophila SB210]|uniref:Uncharacterized protein n=1 Tax=Tetrahymena thermophila (strain SB210) TaxID=312017 RepID=Q22P30_TETTS|nr:hypothetical protein TTHERM_00415630 [Tetrahymena thermophila SB210]EAR86981.2 hypothetical protein TTHERM_00415630 [Tetrahymena thermophila SB210]|eukprot:XP_001007226.2 hypothetical protein TTHERM_00415630 [Tetrahymena thermophila SB210]
MPNNRSTQLFCNEIISRIMRYLIEQIRVSLLQFFYQQTLILISKIQGACQYSNQKSIDILYNKQNSRMNEVDLQSIDDYNNQCDEISQKVDKLIKYLNECNSIEAESQQNMIEVLNCIKIGLDSYDLYSFADFMEEEQIMELLNSINNIYLKYKDVINVDLQEKFREYNSTLENRLLYLDQLQKNKNAHYYILDNNQNNNKIVLENNPQQEEAEIAYRPVKLQKLQVYQNNTVQY